MGGITRLTTLGFSAAIAGGAGMTAGAAASAISEDALARSKSATPPGEPYRPDGNQVVNLDGALRLTMLGAALVGIPAAIGAAMLHAPRTSTGIVGTSIGLTGAALLADTPGRIVDSGLVRRNIASAGSALNAGIHAAFSTSNPDFADHVPLDDAADDIGSGVRPTAEQLRAAPLTLMPGTPDLEAARREAEATLARIDWSKPDIVLWVPGTGAHETAPEFADGVRTHLGDRASLTYVDYPASVDFGPSVSTGMETLRLVLAGIAERGGTHRVSVAGHSQGAWVIADAMAEPAVHDMVDRASLFGTPGMAARHFTDRRDAKVVEINDAGDPFTYPVTLNERMVAGVSRVEHGEKLSGGSDLIHVALRNPKQASYLAARTLEPERWSGQRDPHHYEELFDAAAEWLSSPGRSPATN